ncbi:hypothetical protein Poli38472_014546 [Pythium oligandrum]|uniref:Uncharacterized protein n=1 Tax=Pythium oligandrum TaxID=41045 RepID=A0A8K1CE27_PYTOL|nr:hypothetical protein Poli38472_014546 [Pythium oligandrum]|eukprot:TMW61085.1 hypothetical protein Poli38472_014546 [Pythium oligandrum]
MPTKTLSPVDYAPAPSANTVEQPQQPRDYVERRWALWQKPAPDAPPHAMDFGAILRLPLKMQAAFRRKMLTIFALQLTLVTTAVAIFQYQSAAKDWADRTFDWDGAIWSLIAAAALLVATYISRNRFPLNWLLLLLFTTAQVSCAVALSVAVNTNVGLYNCVFSLVCVVLMVFLAGIRRKRALLSSFYSAMIAYVITAVGASIIYAACDNDIEGLSFGLSLGAQFLLLLWFGYDAATMYAIMSPDEYMRGVIYFYTDLLLMVAMVILMFGMGQGIGAGFYGGCMVDTVNTQQTEDGEQV